MQLCNFCKKRKNHNQIMSNAIAIILSACTHTDISTFSSICNCGHEQINSIFFALRRVHSQPGIELYFPLFHFFVFAEHGRVVSCGRGNAVRDWRNKLVSLQMVLIQFSLLWHFICTRSRMQVSLCSLLIDQINCIRQFFYTWIYIFEYTRKLAKYKKQRAHNC